MDIGIARSARHRKPVLANTRTENNFFDVPAIEFLAGTADGTRDSQSYPSRKLHNFSHGGLLSRTVIVVLFSQYTMNTYHMSTIPIISTLALLLRK